MAPGASMKAAAVQEARQADGCRQVLAEEVSTATPSMEPADTETENDMLATVEVSNAIVLAQKRFQELDINTIGALKREDLQSLSLWIFDRYHPGGEALNTKELKRITEDLLDECTCSNGWLTFQDFADWLERSCEQISRVRRVIAWQRNQTVQFDELECEVIHISTEKLVVSATPFKLTLAAQAALERHHRSWLFGSCW